MLVLPAGVGWQPGPPECDRSKFCHKTEPGDISTGALHQPGLATITCPVHGLQSRERCYLELPREGLIHLPQPS